MQCNAGEGILPGGAAGPYANILSSVQLADTLRLPVGSRLSVEPGETS